MAIASFFVTVAKDNQKLFEEALTARPEIVEKKALDSSLGQDGFAFVIECAADKIPSTLQEFKNLPNVEELHLVFINYEDDYTAD